MIEPMEPGGRWWRVDGHEVDLNASTGTYPLNVRAAVLAHRDADTPEEHDLAALLEWVTEAHPLWDGACPTCGRDCPDQSRIRPLATDWLFVKSQQIHRRFTARLARLEAQRRTA
jgi:hypothetical protein